MIGDATQSETSTATQVAPYLKSFPSNPTHYFIGIAGIGCCRYDMVGSGQVDVARRPGAAGTGWVTTTRRPSTTGCNGVASRA